MTSNMNNITSSRTMTTKTHCSLKAIQFTLWRTDLLSTKAENGETDMWMAAIGRECAFPQRNVRRSPLRARPTWHVHCPPPTLDRFAPCGVELPSELRHKLLHSVGEILHLRGEERRVRYRWPVTHREKQGVPRRSPQCVVDPGRGCQPDPDPARTHSSKLLLPLRDTRELLQTLSPTHLPTNNLHGDGQGSREDGKSGKTGAAEGPHERGRNRTAEDCGARECRQRAALGAEQRALVQRDPRQQRTKKSCSKNVDASRCQPS